MNKKFIKTVSQKEGESVFKELVIGIMRGIFRIRMGESRDELGYPDRKRFVIFVEKKNDGKMD